jgi:hypothetical protein
MAARDKGQFFNFQTLCSSPSALSSNQEPVPPALPVWQGIMDRTRFTYAAPQADHLDHSMVHPQLAESCVTSKRYTATPWKGLPAVHTGKRIAMLEGGDSIMK